MPAEAEGVRFLGQFQCLMKRLGGPPLHCDRRSILSRLDRFMPHDLYQNHWHDSGGPPFAKRTPEIMGGRILALGGVYDNFGPPQRRRADTRHIVKAFPSNGLHVLETRWAERSIAAKVQNSFAAAFLQW